MAWTGVGGVCVACRGGRRDDDVPVTAGGDTSGRTDGPAGVRGLRIHDIPFDSSGFAVDLDAFRREAERLCPALVSQSGHDALSFAGQRDEGNSRAVGRARTF